RPPTCTRMGSSAASDLYKRQALPRVDAEAIDASLLARAAARGAAEVREALYLREADAVPSAGPKRVSQ
ncbi:hypothetical protein NWP09_06875, partial [Agrococcus sp. HG114]|nr:hypothetical protein [Agrococcus sp. HG114]